MGQERVTVMADVAVRSPEVVMACGDKVERLAAQVGYVTSRLEI